MQYTTFYAKLIPVKTATGGNYSISLSGITGVVDGSKTYKGDDLYFAIKPKSSGLATVTFIRDDNGGVIGTKDILVRSLTLANPTYKLSTSATTINEGGSVTITLDTSDVLAGSKLPYTLSGVTTSDITPNKLSGEFVIRQDGTATTTISAVEDFTADGDKTMRLMLGADGSFIDVLIKDTSLPIYTLGWYTLNTMADAALVTSGVEGNTLYLGGRLTGYPANTTVQVTLSGTGITAAKLGLSSLTVSMTATADGSASKCSTPIALAYDIVAGNAGTGQTTINAVFTVNGVAHGTRPLVVNQATATYATGIYASEGSTTKVTDILDTDSVYARITPNKVINGTKYKVTVTGVTATVTGEQVWTDGSLNFLISGITAGTMTVTFTDGFGATVATETLKVTSTAPVLVSTPDGYYRSTDATLLRTVRIGPNEKVLMQLVGGTGQADNSYGQYGGVTSGYPTSDTALILPNVTFNALGNYHQSWFTWNNNDVTWTYVGYGSMLSKRTTGNLGSYLAYAIATPPSGYYADDDGNGNSDNYLDNPYGGGPGLCGYSTYPGLNIIDAIECRYMVDNSVANMYRQYNDDSLTNDYGNTDRQSLLQFTLHNTTAADINIPVILGANVVNGNYTYGNTGHLRLVNETAGEFTGKQYIELLAYLVSTTQWRFNIRPITGVTITGITVSVVNADGYTDLTELTIRALDGSTVITNKTSENSSEKIYTIAGNNYGGFLVSGVYRKQRIKVVVNTNKGQYVSQWNF